MILTMRITYSKKADALYFYLKEGAEVETTEEEEDGVILDYDKDRRLLGIEILDASKRITPLVSADPETSIETPSAAAAA